MNYLIKKIAIITLLFFTLVIKGYAEIVNKVETEGNERISLQTIVIFGDITFGENYESADINSLIKKLYETNFFSDISVELNNGLLKIIVKENPIINTIEFKGEKAEKYKETVSELLLMGEKTSFINSYIKADINKIREFYRSLGF